MVVTVSDILSMNVVSDHLRHSGMILLSDVLYVDVHCFISLFGLISRSVETLHLLTGRKK